MNSVTKDRLRGICVALVLLVLIQWLDYKGWFASWNGRIHNLLLANRSTKSDTAVANDIFTVEIDNSAYQQCFQSASPMNPARISNLIQKIAEPGRAEAPPKVVGVDIRTEGTGYQLEVNGNLAKLTPAIVWISAYEEAVPYVPSFGSWLVGGRDQWTVKPTAVLGMSPYSLPRSPQTNWGIPLYPREDDFAVRRFPRSVTLAPDSFQGGGTRPSFAKRVADLYCDPSCTNESADEVDVSYAGVMPRRFKMLDLFTCPGKDAVEDGAHAWATFKYVTQGSIVLVGGTFDDARDSYPTPVGNQSGLMVNAYAVKAELEGNGFEELNQPWAWLLDLALAILILMICDEPTLKFLFGVKGESALLNKTRLPALFPGFRRKQFVISAGLVFAVCLISLFVAKGRYLLGFAGEGFGVLLDRVRDDWKLSKEEDEGGTEHAQGPIS